MHRVELKDICDGFSQGISEHTVPNAPCGVESKALETKIRLVRSHVPNAPCGVESHSKTNLTKTETRKVPNAPCGVESFKEGGGRRGRKQFLMHRVELKVCQVINITKSFCLVPNAPCGVERVFFLCSL